MANEEIDSGNAGTFWRTYKGKYGMSYGAGVTADTDSVMLATVNVVQFMQDLECVGITEVLPELFALSPECCPAKPVDMLCAYTKDGAKGITVLTINEDGHATCPITGDFTLHLNGLSFNIAANWYGG